MDYQGQDQMTILADKIQALEETLKLHCETLETRCIAAEARCAAMEKRCAKAEAEVSRMRTTALTPMRRASPEIEPSLDVEVVQLPPKRSKRPSTAAASAALITPSTGRRGRPSRAAQNSSSVGNTNTTTNRRKSAGRKKATPNFRILDSEDETTEDVEPGIIIDRPVRSAALKKKTPAKVTPAKVTPAKVTPAKEPTPPPSVSAGAEIIGKCIWISWPNNGSKYKGLVVGYSKAEEKHKVFYIDDETTETMVLKDRTWNLVEDEEIPWAADDFCGKKLFVMWSGFYEDEVDQKKAREKQNTDDNSKTKIPYECFVIKKMENGEHTLLYTYDDNLETRDLSKESNEWKFVEFQSSDADGLPFIMWTGDEEDED